jgi:hypothetical protein
MKQNMREVFSSMELSWTGVSGEVSPLSISSMTQKRVRRLPGATLPELQGKLYSSCL